MSFHLRQPQEPDRRPRVPSEDVAWIAEHRRPFFDYAVGSLVPVVFEAYARVFHPAWALSEGKDTPLRWDAVAAWSGRTMHALAHWESLSVPVASTHAAPPFAAPPDTDGLDPRGLAALCDVLAAHTQTPDDGFMGVWEGYGWPVETWGAGADWLDLENRRYLVRRGPLALALDIVDAFAGRSRPKPPNLLWPADRAWFVASDTDLNSTYVGGSASMVEALVAQRRLEVWPLTATDHITIDSDGINA